MDGCFAPTPGIQLARLTLQKRTYPRIPLMAGRWIANDLLPDQKALGLDCLLIRALECRRT